MVQSEMQQQKKVGWKINEILAILVFIWFAIAWFIGKKLSEKDLTPFLQKAYPQASYTSTSNNIYEVTDQEGSIMAYVSVGRASGYGGPIAVAVSVTDSGSVNNLAVLAHRETPTFFDRVMKSDILNKLVNTNAGDPIQFDSDIDGLTGATFTSRALTQAVQQAVHRVGRSKLNLDIPSDQRKIMFGFPEILLISLFVVAVLQRKVFTGKVRKIVRWVTLLTGLIFLGFLYNRPFVLAHVNMVLLGYWPAWDTHIYWYILIAGLFLFKAREKWNIYCYDFCPFGACQEVIGAIGGAKPRPIKWREALRWSQRILAIIAVSMALIFGNPGFSSFEIFGTLFALDGSSFQFVVLAIILLFSFFVYRPFCNYLCPLHRNTMEGLFDRTRQNSKKLWQNLSLKLMRS